MIFKPVLTCTRTSGRLGRLLRCDLLQTQGFQHLWGNGSGYGEAVPLLKASDPSASVCGKIPVGLANVIARLIEGYLNLADDLLVDDVVGCACELRSQGKDGDQ
jgi:hypothetical protein